MPIRKIASIVRAAGRDAALARSTSHTPEFRKAVTKDRRSALSQYTTVKHALRDRERIAAAKGGGRKNGASARKNGGSAVKNGKKR